MKTYIVTYCAHLKYDPTLHSVEFRVESGFDIDQVWDLFKIRHGGHVVSVEPAR